jgi:hypothetical protein
MTNLVKEKNQLEQNYVATLENLITNFNDYFDIFIHGGCGIKVNFNDNLYFISYDDNKFEIDLNNNTITHKREYTTLFSGIFYDKNLPKILEELHTKYYNFTLKKKTENRLTPLYQSSLLEIFNKERNTKYKSFSDIDWYDETKYMPLYLLELFKDYIDWHTVCYNQNLTIDFVLEHIAQIDLAKLLYYNEKFTDDEIKKILKSSKDDIDKDVIMEYLLDDYSLSYGINELLVKIEYLAKFNCIDWNKLTSEIKMSQEFIIKFNKYWNNDNEIVKSIQQNHN